jgi:hypothetical protein
MFQTRVGQQDGKTAGESVTDRRMENRASGHGHSRKHRLQIKPRPSGPRQQARWHRWRSRRLLGRLRLLDRINFLQPVRIGDKLRFLSRIVYTGRTSCCVEVSIERISRDRETKALSNTCVFTFVAVDAAMRPQPVPRVFPTTYAEDARYLSAHRRRRRLAARRAAVEPVASAPADG